ncbi:P-loop containing nucleoside triphosphate hydrolase protein [Suillus subluteus]|nr:P-loop containing nucleoside triphosphate hydrolase protein [Suillus subluteus]
MANIATQIATSCGGLGHSGSPTNSIQLPLVNETIRVQEGRQMLPGDNFMRNEVQYALAVVPALVDMCCALVFVVKFEPASGVMVGVVIGSYIWTVKYFGGEEYEVQIYMEAIGEYRIFERRVVLSLNLLNLVQTLIITSGLLLYFSLSNLCGVYRAINQSLVDTEKTHLLNEPTDSEVVDAPDVKELVVSIGEAEYVVTLSSLRRAMGVVPQDPVTVLFNISIGYNIAYGQLSTTPSGESTIISRAQVAQTHDRIMSFPEGYETKVEERGMRLSGSEKRRVAIARTMVKNPKVLLLDEVTNELDSATERGAMEGALGRFLNGRSCLSITHQLITINGADVTDRSNRARMELLELNIILTPKYADILKPQVRLQARFVKDRASSISDLLTGQSTWYTPAAKGRDVEKVIQHALTDTALIKAPVR